MSFFQTIPKSSRATYVRHLRFSLLIAVAAELTFEISKYIARRELNLSVIEMGLVMTSPFVGMILSIFSPMLIRGTKKLHYIRTVVLAAFIPAIFLGLIYHLIRSGSLQGTWLYTLIFGVSWLCYPMIVPVISAIMKSNYPDSKRSSIYAAVVLRQLLLIFLIRQAIGQLLIYWPESYTWFTPLGALLAFWSLYEISQMRVMDEPPEETEPTESTAESDRRADWSVRTKMPGQRFGFYPQATSDGELFSWHESISILRSDRAYLWYEMAFSLAGFANLIGIPLYYYYLVDILETPVDHYTQLISLQPLLMALTIGFWGRLFDRRQSPIWQRMVLNTIWMAPPCGYLLSALGIGPILALNCRHDLNGFLSGRRHVELDVGRIAICP